MSNERGSTATAAFVCNKPASIFEMKRLLENWRGYLMENQKRKVNIFLDMDGVLVDFPTAVSEYIVEMYSLSAEEAFPNSKSSRVVHRKLQDLQLVIY